MGLIAGENVTLSYDSSDDSFVLVVVSPRVDEMCSTKRPNQLVVDREVVIPIDRHSVTLHEGKYECQYLRWIP